MKEFRSFKSKENIHENQENTVIWRIYQDSRLKDWYKSKITPPPPPQKKNMFRK